METQQIVMAQFKTVLGHPLQKGTPLVVVAEPAAPGEVDQAMANRLLKSGIAVDAGAYCPTPVETREEEAARLIEQSDGEVPMNDVPAELLRWQADDAEAGKAAGDTVTNADLRLIAAREDVPVEGDDNKADLIGKILGARAARVDGE